MINKKGYTLIEIILSLSIIIIIGTITIITYKNFNKKDDEKVQYVNAIKLESFVYVDNKKNDIKFSNLKDPNDFVYIQLKDLIDYGVLDENIYNPFTEVSTKNSYYSLVKIFLDDEKNLDIEYPTEYEEKIREEYPPEEVEEVINNSLKEAIIHLNNNNDEGNQFVLPKSNEMLNVINELKMYRSSYYFYKDLYDGNYNNYIDPGYYLSDYYGNIIPTTNEDWCVEGPEKIYKSKNNWDGKWLYTYNICENSNIRNQYANIISTDNKRIVTMVDNDAPVLLSDNDSHEYESGIDSFQVLYNYSGYLDFWSMYYFGSSYYVFDNYDGYDDTSIQERLESLNFTYNLLTKDMILRDSHNNIRTYNIDINLNYNEPPYIYYDGPNYFYDYEIYYNNGEIYPIYDNIYVWDYDDNLEGQYYYLYSDNGDYYYPYDNKYISAGNYTLWIEAYDFVDYNYLATDIFIDYYYYYDPSYDDYDPWYDDYGYDDYGYDDYYCGDICIIEQMERNSDAWWGASDAERERLHEENEWLSGQLSGDVYYTDDGYWYNSDGSYLYGNDYYGYDYYGYDYYGYDYYGYDCCW